MVELTRLSVRFTSKLERVMSRKEPPVAETICSSYGLHVCRNLNDWLGVI